jgi:GTP pyrophosphokinase
LAICENKPCNCPETLDIFAPLANRLGIWQIKWELEDLGFRYTEPEKYKEIARNLAGDAEEKNAWHYFHLRV